MLQIGHPCGLCNRLDVIVTGYLLAAARGEEAVELRWPLNAHLPVSFHALFTHLPFGPVVEREIEPAREEEFWLEAAALPDDYRNTPLYTQVLRRVLDCAVPEIKSDVQAFVDAHFRGESGTRTIGVHIRRTERPRPICNFAQPLRYYEAAMKSFPRDTRFFVSTDAQDAFRWLQRRFGPRVFQRPKAHDNRSDVGGVREGLVDMLLLSRCNGIIGTFGSSFSGMAVAAAGCRALMVEANPRVPDGWPFSRCRWLWAWRHFVLESTFWTRELEYTVRPLAAGAYHGLMRWRRRAGTRLFGSGATR